MDEEQQQAEAFQAETDKVNEAILDRVWPILDEIEEAHPEQSAFFIIFINCIHELLYQGWELDDLLTEVKDHHQIFVEEEGGNLH